MIDALVSFEQHRPKLLRIAHRMLGAMSDAEDVVQDAYLRWHETDRAVVQAPEALLVRTVVRLAIDRKRRQETERESYFGTWLPEPWLGHGSSAPATSDELGYAALVLLERLSPEERAAFLMREVLDLEYDFVAEALEKSEPACRKLVQRAKERLGSEPHKKHEVSLAERSELMRQLLALTRVEDADQLQRLLAPTLELLNDGGGKVFAARYPLHGAARIMRSLSRFVRKASVESEVVELGGDTIGLMFVAGKLFAANWIEVQDGRIQRVFTLMNPDKLERLARMLAR